MLSESITGSGRRLGESLPSASTAEQVVAIAAAHTLTPHRREGSFGVIFEGTNLLNNTQVAIKFEPRKSDAPQLRDEYRTYKILVGCRESILRHCTPPLAAC
jgi:hypothetical protein